MISVSNAQVDAIKQALDEYASACDRLRSDSEISQDAKTAVWRQWLDRFGDLSQRHPDSPYYAAAITKALGLANGLGEFGLSKELASVLLEFANDDVSRLRWHGELGEISAILYRQTNEMAEAEEAVAHLEEMARLAHRQPGGDALDKIGVQTVHNLALLAELKPEVHGEQIAAANMYRQASELAARLGESQRQSLRQLRYDDEYFRSSEMVAAVRGGQFERAYASLEELSSLRGARWPGSYYLYQLANESSPDGGDEFEKTVTSWLDEREADDWTPFLQYHLAMDLIRYGKDLQAFGYLKKLADEQWDLLFEQDSDARARGRGGFLAGVLFELGRIYVELGMKLEAEHYLALFLDLYPNDPRVGKVEELIRLVFHGDTADHDGAGEVITKEVAVREAARRPRTGLKPERTGAKHPVENTLATTDLRQHPPIKRITTVLVLAAGALMGLGVVIACATWLVVRKRAHRS